MKSKFHWATFILFIVFILFGAFIFKKEIKKIVYKPLCPDCNVILISVDTLGSNHLPCYGYERNTAPNLCKFAKENILFTNSYSNASWTLPSHFSIFTSLYPKHHGVERTGKSLSAKIPTLTQVLKGEGYETTYTGPIGDPYLPLDKGLGRGFDQFFRVNIGIENWDKGYKRFVSSSKQGKKNFLFLHTYWVHDPYIVDNLGAKDGKRVYATKDFPDVITSYEKKEAFTEDLRTYLERELVDEKLKNKIKSAGSLADAEVVFKSFPNELRETFISQHNLDLLGSSSERIQYAKDLYDELIVYFDKEMAKFFQAFYKSGLDKNTIVIITSDHGEEFHEHGNMGHPADHLYNTTTSTPLIFYIPGVKNRTIGYPVQSIDIMPTVLDLVGAKTPNNFHMEGIDLVDVIAERPFPEVNNYLISQGPNDSIRNRDWKLYINYSPSIGQNTWELFNVLANPQENQNLALKEKQTSLLLFDRLQKIIYRK